MKTYLKNNKKIKRNEDYVNYPPPKIPKPQIYYYERRGITSPDSSVP